MPFVPGAIAAVSASTVTFAGVQIGVGAFLVNTVSSIAMSALATAIRGKPDVRTPGISTQTTTAGGTIPQRLIFGRYATAGQMVAPMMAYQTDGNPNEWLVYVISLADKPVAGLGRILVDGQALTIDGNPAASQHGDAMGATVLDTDQDSLRNKIYIRFHDGNQTDEDAYLRRVFGTYPERPWTDDMIGTGVAYAVVTFKGKAQDGDYAGFPAIKFEVDGHALLDPRDGQVKFTKNPAVIAYNILRGIDIPGGDVWGVGARSFVPGYVIAAANVCDQQVPRTDGTLRPRYQAGLEVSVSDEPHQALMEVVKAMGGDVADMGGTWLLTAGDPGTVVLSITDDDIIVTDSRSLKPYPGLDETVNAIHASYPDPAQQWEAKEAVPLYNAAYEAKDGGRRLIAEVDFPAVPYPQQVRALMREMLADHRRMRTHVITLPPDALGVKLGDHIAWTSAINGYNGKLFKVTAIRLDPLSLCVAFTLTERDPSDYDYDPNSDGIVPTVPSPQPVAPTIVGVTGWDVQAVNAGGRPGIRMVWNPEINARALSWVIRLASDGSEANSGTTSDMARGENVQTAGLKGSTTYRVTGRLVIPGRGTESVTTTVTTLALGIGRDELDEDVRDLLDDAREFIDETPGVIQGVRDEVAADIALVDTRITNETAALSGEVAAARQLAIDNLLVAQNYTDTSVQSETVARQTETGQLAARIDQITAAPTSSNLLVNGDFADGTTGWTGVTVSNGKGTVTAAGAEQTFAATFSPAEMLQWRVEYSGPAGQVRVAFLNGSGAVIGSEVVTNLAASTTAKIGSGQHAPPDGTAQVRWRVTGTGMVIDNAAVTKIDQQTLARIQSLEAAVASDTQALATYKTEVAARFGTTDAAISSEATTRANADTAIANRTTALETTTSNHAGRITTAETTLATATESLAQLQQLTEAESGRRDLVRDGTFARVATHWPGGSLPTAGRLIARDEASTDARVKSVPAPRYYNLLPSDAAGTWRDTDFQAVTPGEVIDVRFDYVRGLATSVVPAERVVFYGPNKAILGTPYTLRGDGFGADWRTASGQAIAPVGAVYAKTQAGVAATGTSAAGITNVSAMRTGAGYASRSSVQVLSQALTDDQQALANYQIAVNSRFTNVEAQSQASADALLNVYTKSQADQATAGQIAQYDASLQGALALKASVSSVESIRSRVTATEQGLAAEGERITSLTADVGNFRANGLFRVSVHATPTGALSRIGLFAVASANDANRSAGLYLEAVTGSKSRALVVADQFAVVTGPSDAPKFPFIVDGSNIRMDADVWIKSLSIGPDKIQIDGLSKLWSGSFAKLASSTNNSWSEVGRITFTPYAAGSKILVIGNALLSTGDNATLFPFAIMRVLINGAEVFRRSVTADKKAGGGAYATEDWVSIVGMGFAASGSNTVIVQVISGSDNYTVSLDQTKLFVTEFKR